MAPLGGTLAFAPPQEDGICVPVDNRDCDYCIIHGVRHREVGVGLVTLVAPGMILVMAPLLVLSCESETLLRALNFQPLDFQPLDSNPAARHNDCEVGTAMRFCEGVHSRRAARVSWARGREACFEILLHSDPRLPPGLLTITLAVTKCSDSWSRSMPSIGIASPRLVSERQSSKSMFCY